MTVLWIASASPRNDNRIPQKSYVNKTPLNGLSRGENRVRSTGPLSAEWIRLSGLIAVHQSHNTLKYNKTNIENRISSDLVRLTGLF